jgi:F-box/WD-40 domain protein MET30
MIFLDLVGYVYSVEVGGEYFYIGKKVYPFILKYSVRKFNSKLIFEGHTNTVFALYVSNNILLSGSADTSVICWNAATGDIIRILSGHIDFVQVVGLFDGFVYSAGTDLHIIKWNLDTGQVLKKFPIVHSIEIRCFAYKQSELFSGSLDGAVVKWDAVIGDALSMYKSRNTKLRAVANWKNFVISAGEDIEIKFWDASIDSINPYNILVGHLRSINSLSVFEDFIFSGGSDTTVRQWDMIRFALEKVFEGNLCILKDLI